MIAMAITSIRSAHAHTGIIMSKTAVVSDSVVKECTGLNGFVMDWMISLIECVVVVVVVESVKKDNG